MPPEDIRALVNQGLKPEDMGLRTIAAAIDEDDPMNNIVPAAAPTFLLFDDQPLSPISISTSINSNTVAGNVAAIPSTVVVQNLDAFISIPQQQQQQQSKLGGIKRKAEPEPSSSGISGVAAIDASTSSSGVVSAGSTAATGTGDLKSDNISTASSSKKIRRAQTKVKFSSITNNSGKTRSK